MGLTVMYSLRAKPYFYYFSLEKMLVKMTWYELQKFFSSYLFSGNSMNFTSYTHQ